MALDRTGFKSLNRTPEQRSAEFNRLLTILEEANSDSMSPADRNFYDHMQEWDSKRPPSEEQLAWLRDLVEKYL
jgi:hypothetical protein